MSLSGLTSALTAATARPLDHLFSRIAALNGPFFPKGWGDLSVVQLEQDLECIREWPPPPVRPDWKQVGQGRRDGCGYKIFTAKFTTPCMHRVYDALPPESRTASVQLMVPDSVRPHPEPSLALMLAATGDQGFSRRLSLCAPLLSKGVSTMVLESPFYGARKPAGQVGSKLRVVSDLLVLGWATIFESICLLHMAQTHQGYARACVSGLSMGGVHACMTAGLYRGDVACAPLLAPRSAAIAYCDGPMHAAMAWDPLAAATDAKNVPVGQVVSSSAQSVSVMAAAKYALAELQAAMADAERRGVVLDHGRVAAAAAALEAANEAVEAMALRQPPHPPGRAPHAGHATAAPHAGHATAAPHADRAAAGARPSAAAHAAGTTLAGPRRPGPLHGHVPAHAPGHAAEHAHGGVHGLPRGLDSSQQPGQHQQPTTAARGETPATSHQLPPVWGAALGAAAAVAGGVKGVDVPLGRVRAPHLTNGHAPGARRVVEWMRGRLEALRKHDKGLKSAHTISTLKQVLEVFTDVTRYPVPRRPDAAVMVAARDDAYVSVESVEAIHAHWPGSELRMVGGGHVSGFLLQQPHFRAAILDSLKKL